MGNLSRRCLAALVLAFCIGAAGGWSPAALGAAPTVTAIGPNNGAEAGGTSVTITGTGFVSGSTVKFGPTAATSVSIATEKSITATSPQGKGLVDVTVTNSNGTSAATPADQFAYDAPPESAWLGLNGNSATYLPPISFFVEHNVAYSRPDYVAGELPAKEDQLEVSINNGMRPIVTIEFKGYEGKFGTPNPSFPTEANGKLGPYVKGFLETAKAMMKLYPGKKILFEPMNEPWGETEPVFNGAEYAKDIAKLLPEAQAEGIPLNDIYVGAYGNDCTQKECGGLGCTKGCVANGWVPAMYEAQPKLEKEIQGWYFHPYGHPTGTESGDSWGIESVPVVQEKMTSGQNNIIVSEVGYCALDVHEGADCGELGNPSVAEKSVEAGQLLTEMLHDAQPYYQAGWLRALLVYSRSDGGWEMQDIPFGGFLTAQGSALTSYADAAQIPTASSSFGSSGSEEGKFETPWDSAVDPRTANVYVSDNKLDRVEEFSPNGTFLASIGSQGSGNGQLKDPEGVAVDSAGDLYVGDAGNHRVEEFNSAHEYAAKFGSEGTGEGQFGSDIGGLTIDSSGDVWVTDSVNNRVEEFSSSGKYLSKFGSEGSENGQFFGPLGITIDGGNLYVTDYFNHRVQEFSMAGAYKAQFGSLGEGKGQFEAPAYIATDQRTGNLYVTDYNADRVEELSSTGVFIAWLGEFGSGKGQFNDPKGIATNSTGGIDVVDLGNHRVDVWASPGPNWEDMATANPSEATANQLASISCTTGCEAVGSTTKMSTKEALGEFWNGTEWTLQSVPNPKGAKAAALSGVSCSTSSACTAVGSYTEASGGEVTLAEGWNGKEWSAQSTPKPNQAKASVFAGVACPTKACTAVGYATTKASVKEPVIAGWEGTKWSQQSAAMPKSAKTSSLGSVGCSSSNACTAVGSYVNSSGAEVTLAEGWNGKEWTVQSTPNPSQAKASVLAGVACPTKACYAVGSYVNGSGVKEPLAETYSGTEWSQPGVPDPNGAKAGELSSVSCVSAVACTAVGSFTSKAGAKETLAMGWNGLLWSLQSTPNPSEGKGDVLAGVSCVWVTGCYDVGSYTNAKSTQVTLGQKYFG